MQKTKLQQLLKVFTPDSTALDFSVFDNEFKTLKDKLKEKVTVKTLEDVNIQLEKSRKQTSSQLDKLNFQPLLDAFEKLKTDLGQNSEQLVSTLNEKQTQLSELVRQSNELASQGDEGLKTEIETLIAEVAVLQARKIEIPDFGKQIKDTESKLVAMIETAKTLDTLEDEKEKEEIQKQFVAFEVALKKLKIGIASKGGGSMNRKITFGGVDYLTRYTDINYKAGTNVTFTVVQNNQTKTVDVTLTATGSGGSVRSISSVATPTNAGATAGTDYVYLVSGTTQITMPTAVGNTNLYTIKNVGTGIVTVVFTGVETGDGQTSLIMPVQYTSIDLVSDTANWNIT